MRAKPGVSGVALAAAVGMLLGQGGPVEARPDGRTSIQAGVASDPEVVEAFRVDLKAYLEGMRAVAKAAGVPSDLDVTLRELPTMPASDLAVLQAAFERNPSWNRLPRTLRSLVRHRHGTLLAPRSPITPQVTADDCETARSWGYTQTDVEIAADAALAADAILEAVPQDLISAAARVVAVAAWAVPQGVLRGFEHSYNIAQACDAADF
jgi:hypothetical protein